MHNAERQKAAFYYKVKVVFIVCLIVVGGFVLSVS